MMLSKIAFFLICVSVFLVGVSIFIYVYFTEIHTLESTSDVDLIEESNDTINDPKFITSKEECARLFDKIFDDYNQHVDENYGGSGQPILEPAFAWQIILEWEFGEEFRNTDCRFTVDDWSDLVENKDALWGEINWPELETFQ